MTLTFDSRVNVSLIYVELQAVQGLFYLTVYLADAGTGAVLQSTSCFYSDF